MEKSAEATHIGLAVTNVSKTYGATRALRDVSFQVERGHLHALVGENGCGKSTLVKILAGVVQSDRGGSIEIDGTDLATGALNPDVARAHNLHFVHQDPGLFSDMTVADNLCLGSVFPTQGMGRISRRRQNGQAEEILDRFRLVGVRPTDRVAGLSSGRRTMLAIARALKDQAELSGGVLVLDEPTAALPEKEAQHLLDSLREFAAQGKTILYVTHRLDEVLRGADSFTALRDGQHVATGSTNRLTKSALVEHIVGRSLTEMFPPRTQSAKPSLAAEVKNVAVGACRDVSFTVRDGEVVGLAGILGSGRSTMLKAMFGQVPLDTGAVTVGSKPANLSTPADAMRSGMGYVPEDRQGEAVLPDLQIRANFAAATIRDFWNGIRMDTRLETSEANRLIENLGVRCQSPKQPIAALSGGNQQKVIIGRWLRSQPRLLMLDEPTQGVDVGARADIYKLIRGAAALGMGVLVVSSDFEELTGLCDRVLVLRHGVITHELSGDELDVARVTELAHATTLSTSIS